MGAGALALALISAGPASAFTVWQEDGSTVAGNTNIALTTGTAGLSFAHSGGMFGPITIDCAGTGAGTVGTGGSGTITGMTFSSCATTAGSCGTPNGALVNLSWTSQLSGSRYQLTGHGGGGAPGWQVVCFGFVKITCTGNTDAAVGNRGSGVDLAFDSTSPNWSCDDGGTEALRGTISASISGHTLAAS